MSNDFTIIEQIAPDMIQVIEQRFRILRNIYWNQPVGRRKLSDKLNLTERILRSETEVLKQLNLIDVSKIGMSLTEKGLSLYSELEIVMAEQTGNRVLEKKLASKLGIERCLITPGDSDTESKVLEKFGEVISDILSARLPDGDNIIAVMGGTTMATVSQNMYTLETLKRHNIFVPARGGIGETINTQANSISATMAEKTGGEFKVLYVPEQVSSETYELLLHEPTVQRVLELISKSNVVIHSIGRALHMAKRRNMSANDLAMLSNKGAVAESFGYFYNKDGEVVYKIPRIGLQMKDLKKIPYVVAVAGGKTKAKAIEAYIKNAPKQTWLITDEGAAKEILKEETL